MKSSIEHAASLSKEFYMPSDENNLSGKIDAIGATLNAHIKETSESFDAVEARLDKGDKKFNDLIAAIDRNTQANDRAEEVITFYDEAKHFITFTQKLQTLFNIMIKWPLIGAGVYQLYKIVFGNIP